MTVAIETPSLTAVRTHGRAHSPAKTGSRSATPSVARTLFTSVLMGFVLVWIGSSVLISLTAVSAREAIAFGAMVGFWIGIGGGLIAGGSVLSAREERLGHRPTTAPPPPTR